MTKKQLDSQALRILTGARALLDSPEKWTREVLARDANGGKVGIRSPDAVCYCSLGALTKAMNDRVAEVTKLVPLDVHPEVHDQYCTQHDIVFDYLAELAGGDLVGFNDGPDTKYADVVNLFDLAIDNAEERVYE